MGIYTTKTRQYTCQHLFHAASCCTTKRVCNKHARVQLHKISQTAAKTGSKHTSHSVVLPIEAYIMHDRDDVVSTAF